MFQVPPKGSAPYAYAMLYITDFAVREKALHILHCNNLSVVSLEINISLKPSWPALSSKSVAVGGIA